MQLRDLFAMRAHFGWLHALLYRIHRPNNAFLGLISPLIGRSLNRFDSFTQRNSAHFDNSYGTRTYGRIDVPVNTDRLNPTVWGYSAINHDFFREILRAVPVSLASYTFVDIGSGKGAAVLMASEFPFRRLIGVELNPELAAEARRNVVQFNRKTGKHIDPEWSVGDYFKWSAPSEPCLFFFNNPFPEALTLRALERLESMLARNGQPALLVFRKAPGSSGQHLHRSTFWKPLRLAPYWRVYATSPKIHNVP